MSARRDGPQSLKGTGFPVVSAARRRGRVAELVTNIEALDESLAELGAVLREQPSRLPELPVAAAPAYVLTGSVPSAGPSETAAQSASFQRRFAARNMRRLRVMSLPMALGVALLCFALIRLPSANTAWTQEVTLSSAVGTGEFSCQPLKLTYVSATPDGVNTTRYTYTLTGGGPNPNTCKEIAWISLAACSTLNPALAPTGAVLSETHPGLLNTAWTYAPQQPAPPTAAQIRWTSISGGSGPFTAQFTFDLAGAPAPLVSTPPQVLMTTPNSQPVTLPDAVSVPCPAAPLANNQPSAKTSVDPGPAKGDDGGYSGPVATPTATNTPTPTPTPKGGNSQKPIGVAIFPATPTPTPGHK